MTLKLWRVVLILALIIGVSGALAAPARAESLQTAETQVIAGIVVVSVGKRKRSGTTFVFEARSVTQDLGICQS